MKAVKTALIVVVIASLILWVRGGAKFSIQQVFPLLGGHRPGIYEWGGIAMLLITLWGLGRLRRTASRRSDYASSEHFEPITDDTYSHDER